MPKIFVYSFFLALITSLPLKEVMGQEDSTRYNQYGVKVSRQPLSTEVRNGILVFESALRDYKLWFDSRVQFDGAIFFGKTLNPTGNGTTIRRARFALKADLQRNWYAELDLDFSNSDLALKDAYLAYDFFNGLKLKAGNFKEAFSMEETTTSRYLTFLERPNVVSALAPSRHIGLASSFHRHWFLAFLGVSFQKVSDLEATTATQDNNKDYGVDEGGALTGKLVIMPFPSQEKYGLHFGYAASYRTPTTDNAVRNSFRYSTRSLTYINRKKYLDTDDIPDVNHSRLQGYELAGFYRNFRVQSEWMMTKVNRNKGLKSEIFGGFYAFGSYLLFGGQYRYNAGSGEFTQPKRGKKWGDIELAVRYDYIDLNSRPEGVMGGAGEGITFGLNFLANENVKIMLNYTLMNHDRYANGKGKLFTGHDINGNLTSNPSLITESEGEAGDDLQWVGIRFEVDF